MRIISFIDQPEMIRKILKHLDLWEESHAPPDRDLVKREITFDPSLSFKVDIKPDYWIVSAQDTEPALVCSSTK